MKYFKNRLIEKSVLCGDPLYQENFQCASEKNLRLEDSDQRCQEAFNHAFAHLENIKDDVIEENVKEFQVFFCTIIQIKIVSSIL